jgi:hypothetical protein
MGLNHQAHPVSQALHSQAAETATADNQDLSLFCFILHVRNRQKQVETPESVTRQL